MTAKSMTQPAQEVARPIGRAGLLAYAAACLSLLAAVIHLWVAPEHFEEWWGYGTFFVVSALCQGVLGVLLLRWPGGRSIPIAGIAGNLAIISLYVVSRTWGMPFGADWVLFSPNVAHIENAGFLGMTATAAEVGIVVALATLLDGAYRRWTMNFLLLVGALFWTLRFTGILP